jgi:hypothetical protein
VLRNREPGESPTKAVLRALGEDLDELEELPDETQMLLPLFAETVAATPSLRAAWLDLQGRLVEVATEQLAAVADVDPRDPEPVIAARAIVGLYELAFAARIRHVEQGLRGRELTDAVLTDLERAARLLDTGLWSFNLLTQGARAGQQLRDAALAAAEDTKQVVNALKQARATWREIRGREQGEVKREHGELKRVARELLAAERREGKRGASPPGATVRQGTQRTKKSVREANAAAERAAYESFRQRLEERHEAIRERRAALRAAAGAKL